MIIKFYPVVLEIMLRMPELTKEKAEREVVFLSAQEFLLYKRDKLLIHFSVSSHQRESR